MRAIVWGVLSLAVSIACHAETDEVAVPLIDGGAQVEAPWLQAGNGLANQDAGGAIYFPFVERSKAIDPPKMASGIQNEAAQVSEPISDHSPLALLALLMIAGLLVALLRRSRRG